MIKHSVTTIILHVLLCLRKETLGRNLIESMMGEGMADRGLLSQLVLDAAPPRAGSLLDRKSWTVTCENSHAGNECSNMIDGDPASFYHSEYEPTATPLPHTITIDLKEIRNVNGIVMLPRQDGGRNGIIAGHSIHVSLDGRTFSDPVALGTWFADTTEKFSVFETVKARYIRIVHTTEPENQPFTCVAELGVFTTPTFTTPHSSLGIWGPTIDCPIVPSAVAVLHDGRVLMWSSYSNDAFVGGPGGLTFTATYDPTTRTISQRTVTDTHHDMFCPGLCQDANGRVFVTGGNDASKTSIYEPGVDSWVSGPNMTISRGYQASTLCADGRIFVIGGSWNGGVGNKNGEIYDPNTNRWSLLPGCPVQPMVTADKQGTYRGDNHGWLFGWKGNSVFQAGPSKAMNWYSTNGAGGHRGAGPRGRDTDAMCGVAVMFDAVAGKILTAGGAPSYMQEAATTNAHLITLGNPKADPQVQETGNRMNFPRIYHNGVVLPNGEVFIVGGQVVGTPFFDEGWQNTSEIYCPKKDRFRPAAPNSIPRNYHSFAVLLQDATVISGGGGLCGSCDTNHFDFQIYSPAYLFNSDGSRATRPVITAVSSATVRPGGRLAFKTDGKIISASLVRLGSATHTVDTDQRRVPLDLRAASANSYNAVLPADSGILIPGYWFLFVMNGKDVPSIGKIIKVALS
ncbi:unnamed protein product [Bemisia tabaci]|uniref:F5/8 type C domain-containing protein n=1 Tax=Bemisia tabaci TaxID=7038 RepID=A0A9P0A526_BEMTA|nr:unnamed protein product [Bemisia tabaci]